MFTVVPVDTDDGVYSVMRSDGVRLYVHREQRLIGPTTALVKILRIGKDNIVRTLFKDTVTRNKSYITDIPIVNLCPIDSYIEFINRYKKTQHEKTRSINIINEYLRAVDDYVAQTASIKDTIDDIKSTEFQIIDIRGVEYRLKRPGITAYAIYNRANGFIGSTLFILEVFGIDAKKNGTFYKKVRKLKTEFPSEIASVSFNKQVIVMSMQFIDCIIDQCIPPNNRETMKLKFKRLHEELQRICTENATVSSLPSPSSLSEPSDDAKSSITVDDSSITDSGYNESVSERDNMMELTSLIEESMEEPTVDEFNRIVESVANRILLNQTVGVCKNDDGTLEVIMKDISTDTLDRDYVFSKKYLIRAIEVEQLLDKLHDKGIIADIDGNVLTVDDTEFFIDALSYKLMKISERNKKNGSDSASIDS